MSAAAAAAKRRVKKEVDLDSMVLEGPSGAYEALQLYRSRSMRHKSKDDIIGAIAAAAHGAKVLLTNNYETAGAELANLCVEIINEAGMEINPQVRQIIFDVDSSFQVDSPARVEFLKACVKSTIANGQRELGEPSMHLRLANCMWERKAFSTAIYHYVLGEDPEVLCSRIEVTFAENPVQRDRSLCMAILHFLALENLRDANELFRLFRKSQKARGSTSESDLVTFCDYLLQTCRRDAAPLFKTLVNTYASTIDFDEVAPTLLMGPIAQRLFGLQPKSNPMMSMLQNLLS